MKELIDKLRALAFGMALEPIIHQSVVDDISNAADALERLTAGNSEMLPMPFIPTENNLIAWCKDYGDLCAAAAVMALEKPTIKFRHGCAWCGKENCEKHAHPAQPTEQMVTPYISQAQFDRTFPDAPIAQPVQMSKDEFVARSAKELK